MTLSELASSFRCNKFEDHICNKANLRDLIAATGLVILLKFDLNCWFFSPCDLEILWMTSINNTATLLFYIKLCASFQIHWWIQTEVKSLEMLNSGQNWQFFIPCDLEIWWMTLENNRAPLLYYIKLWALFQRYGSIQTGVTVRKRLSWVVTSDLDLWPWPFAWTLLWSLAITPENFMMIRWWEHSQKGVTDRRTDGQTDGQKDRQKIPFVELLGRS